MERQQRWQDWIMLAFGVWLFFSPWILQYRSFSGVAAWDAYILGILIAIFALSALARPQMWPEWVNLVLGIWMIISPYVLGFSNLPTATGNSIVLGILIALDALWAMAKPLPSTTYRA